MVAPFFQITQIDRVHVLAITFGRHVLAAEPFEMTARHTLMRERRDQMLQSKETRPLWQLRAVRDGRDPPSCPGLAYPVLRWDDPFWKTNGPWICQRKNCRCSIRAYGLDETPMP
jgi:hypothetical protein